MLSDYFDITTDRQKTVVIHTADPDVTPGKLLAELKLVSMYDVFSKAHIS